MFTYMFRQLTCVNPLLLGTTRGRLTITPNNTVTVAGLPVVFKCAVDRAPRKMQWRFSIADNRNLIYNGEKFNEIPNFINNFAISADVNSGRSSLTVKNATIAFGGAYQCGVVTDGVYIDADLVVLGKKSNVINCLIIQDVTLLDTFL